MATIREHGEKYQVQIRKKGHKHITKSFKKRADAEAWARKIESEIERGVWHDKQEAEQKTLADVLLDYRDGHASTHEVKDREIPARIDAIIARWPASEKISMLNLSIGHFSEYIIKRQKTIARFVKNPDDPEGPKKPQYISGDTINKELGIMSAAINRAIDGGLPVDNPIKQKIRPKNNNSRTRRLTEAENDEDGKPVNQNELRALLLELKPRERDEEGKIVRGIVENTYVRWIVRFAVETAIRRGELLKLEWRHVKLKKRIVKLYDTKNGLDRDVPLSTRALRCLRVLRKQRAADEPRVFPLKLSTLRPCFERACARAGIEDLHFHDLRHEATSRLAKYLDMAELAKTTGHEDPRVLMRYYHPSAEEMAKKLP